MLADVPEPTAQTNWRRWLGRLAPTFAAAAALILSFSGWWRPLHFQAAPQTAIGESHALTQPDGSKVTLNTDTLLSIAFSPAALQFRSSGDLRSRFRF